MTSDSLFNLKEHPHRRRNPLTGEWVLVSPHRTSRPWQGQLEKLAVIEQPRFDPGCYLCPGNSRAGGETNPAYTSTFVFQNDFSALLPDTPLGKTNVGIHSAYPLFEAQAERGICRVICFSARHDLTLARMTEDELEKVVDVWSEQYKQLSEVPWIGHVQIFENRGAMMGASNPHPHCQIWATSHLPVEPTKEQDRFQAYKRLTGGCLLCDYLKLESSAELEMPPASPGDELSRKGNWPGRRTVCENDHFTALVPFWAVWPFEILLVSKRHLGSMDELNNEERFSLGSILKQITTRYDNLFEVSFPYSMGFHQTPAQLTASARTEWHFHAHFYPPLLRSASVRKFMVGFEILATPQRDITPEAAAVRLREVSGRHYLAG